MNTGLASSTTATATQSSQSTSARLAPRKSVNAAGSSSSGDGSGKSTTLAPPSDTHRFSTESIPSHLAPLSIYLVLVSAALGSLISASLLSAWPMLSPANLGRYLSGRSNASAEALAVSERIFAPQLGLYLAFWGSFHLLEFLVTARWNPSRLMKDSFLLLNGWNYHAAHLFGILEFILESFLFPSHKSPLTFLNYLGLCAVLLGQYLRSTAMIHASSNFSHIVASNKRPDHMLVKTGLYSLVRHPSYTGFFVWAVGTQVLLANPVSTVVFVGVLWRFFQQRIQNEERHLISFFGEEYKEYKRQVPSGIPFVG